MEGIGVVFRESQRKLGPLPLPGVTPAAEIPACAGDHEQTSLKRSTRTRPQGTTRITLTAALPNPMREKRKGHRVCDSPGTKPAMFSSISLGES